jgi:hypothetical protein
MKPFFRPSLFAGLVLLLAALACSLPSVTYPPATVPSLTQPPNQTTPISLPTDTQEATPTPPAAPVLQATETPDPTPTPMPTTAGRMVTYENIRFIVPPDLSQSEQGEIVAAVLNGSPWDIGVQHIKFSFTGYILPDTFHQPVINIFPVEGFAAAAGEIAHLQDLLAVRPVESNLMPFVPLFNAAQMFHAQLKYLDFAGGSGVRYITQYSQAAIPINNREMFYTFQGLTSDGKYYISIIMPVSHSVLPATGEGAYQPDLDDNFGAYIFEVQSQLEAQTSESYTPNLVELDALVESIVVK